MKIRIKEVDYNVSMPYMNRFKKWVCNILNIEPEKLISATITAEHNYLFQIGDIVILYRAEQYLVTRTSPNLVLEQVTKRPYIIAFQDIVSAVIIASSFSEGSKFTPRKPL